MNMDSTPAPKPRRPRKATTTTGRNLYRDAALREQRGFTPDKQADYLAHLRNAIQPGKAAELAGVSAGTVRDHRKKDPAFAEAEATARAQAVEPIVDRLYSLALDGHLTAIMFVLQNRDPDNWKDMRRVEKKVTHEGTVTHELEAGQTIQRIAELQATLSERAALRAGDDPSVIDVEAVDE